MNTKLIKSGLLFVGIILFVVVPVIFYGSIFLAHGRLHVDNNNTVDVSLFYPVDTTRIEKQAAVLNKTKLIEYQCIFGDSCLSYIQVGTVANSNNKTINDMIEQSLFDINDPQDIIVKVTTAGPYFVEGTSTPQYNVYKLPMDDLSTLSMYNNGRIKSIDTISDDQVIYKLATNLVRIALNNSETVDLRYSPGVDGSFFDIDLIFTIDRETNMLSIVTLSETRKF